MIRVLIDTNILLDVLLNRKEFLEVSSAVIKLLLERKYRGFVAATTLTNMYYIVRRTTGKTDDAMRVVDKTLQWCEVAPVNRRVLDIARFSGIHDFEDAVQAAAAHDCHIDIVVTRDKTGFLDSGLNVYSPEEFLETLISAI
ncbi:MAG: PIN domain-containing protein [Planctomycetaceae bacterium]|nr:PIN domain-containing protein [Planctomycetaceae bacterium]